MGNQANRVLDQEVIDIAMHRYKKSGMSYGQSLMSILLDVSMGKIPNTWDNYRPQWLRGLELDRFYQSLNLAFEFQGEQHYTDPAQRKRDQEKVELCARHRVILVCINASDLDPSQFAVKLRGWLRPLQPTVDTRHITTMRKFLTPDAYEYLKNQVASYRISLQKAYRSQSARFANEKLEHRRTH